MRNTALAAAAMIAGFLMASHNGWADIGRHNFANKVCMQKFSNPQGPNDFPEYASPADNDRCDHNQDAMLQSDVIPRLYDVVTHAAPEIKALFDDGSDVKTWIYIIPPPKNLFNFIERVRSISWVQWNPAGHGDLKHTKLDIGISLQVFDKTYSLPIHETASLMQLFWWPGKVTAFSSYDHTTMPYFGPTVTSATDQIWPNDLAIYAILAHEIAHYWQDRYSVYRGSGSAVGAPNSFTPTSGCTGPQLFNSPTATNPIGPFPAISWGYYMTEPSVGSNAYTPPWVQQGGIWGCAGSGTTTQSVNDFIYNKVPWLDQAQPPHLNGGLIQSWPDSNVADRLTKLYTQTSLPSALGATSPEEDFAESYTMLALYNAGLQVLCLHVPAKSGPDLLDKDVMDALLDSGTTDFYTKKANYIANVLPTLKDSAGQTWKYPSPVLPAVNTLPTSDQCQG